MAADNTGAKSSTAADSYVGSLISLTSKSEIRYEGILYNINTDESSIGLQNVRSFGTEGRKKDGQQVPPSEKVYEYILFRGTDIKDLQVKASPPVQPTLTINHDPAIIQSHYPNPMPTSSSLPPPTVSGSMPDVGSHNGQHGMGFQNNMPLYQPHGNIGSWGASPQPPMYWQGPQGFYPAPPNGLPQLHQQSLLPPQGMPMPPLQQPLQYPNFNAPLPSFSSVMQGSSLPEASSPFFSTTSQIQVPSSLSSSGGLPATLSFGLQSTLASAPSASLASDMSPPLLPNKAPIAEPLTLSQPQDSSLPSLPLSTTRAVETSAGAVPLKQATPLTSASFVGSSSSISQDKPKPLLVTPAQLLQSGSAAVPLSTPSQTTNNDVEVVQVSSSAGSEQSLPNTSAAQPPILPLPSSARPSQQPNGHSFPTHNGYRGRGRGRGRGAGRSNHVMKFSEDFDFTAMNEKFNKDEVWGQLGKNGTDGDGNDEYPTEEEAELPQMEVKSVYNKDDFFDSLSSNAINRDSQNARPRFSEQRKLDTETFGEFSRFRGRGYGRNGFSRGRGYGGRGGGGGGYGYRGGRGHVSNRTF